MHRDQFPPTVSQAQYETDVIETRAVSTSDSVMRIVAADQDLKVRAYVTVAASGCWHLVAVLWRYLLNT